METKGPRGTPGRIAVLELLGALKDVGGLWGGNSATQPRTALCTLLGLPGGQAMGHAWNPGGL